MKTFISQHQKLKSIGRVMNKYPEAFANKVKAQAMIDSYSQQSDELSELIAQLLRPASTIHRPKQDSQQKLVTTLLEFVGMGIMLATHLNDMPLLDILKVYKAKINNVSAYKHYEMAVHVAEELEKRAELADEFGISAAKMLAFKELVADFGTTLDNTGWLLSSRKSGWSELKKKLSACSKMVRLQIDPYIIFNEKEFPELFREYMLVRGSRKRRKRPAADDLQSGDISGTITDSVSGLPLANVIINLVGYETAYTSDDDGYYLLEELVAGTYTLTCHLPGYEVPQLVSAALTPGESLLVDFALVPVANPMNN